MLQISLEEIKKKFDTLPEELRWAIIEAKIDEKVIDIGRAENLTVAQMGQLALETYAVMLGYTSVDNFDNSLKQSMGLAEEKIKKIALTINEKILRNVRERLIQKTEPPKEKPPTQETPKLVVTKPTTPTMPKGVEERIEIKIDPDVKKATPPQAIAQKSESLEERLIKTEIADLQNRIQNAGNDRIAQMQIPKFQEKIKELGLKLLAGNTTDTNLTPKDTTMNSIPEKRLMGTFKLPSSVSDHSIIIQKTNPILKNEPPKIDPYRESPE